VQADDQKIEDVCPAGQPIPRGGSYRCEFCSTRLHRGDSGCGCSELRKKVTSYSSLCHEHAAAIDVLTADTAVGLVHRRLVQKADMAGRPCSD
jgi:hypothetical protein